MLEYEIQPAEAAQLIAEGKARLIDVREPWEHAAAHVEGAILIPMGEFAARAHQELDPDDHLLILCHLGARSLSVTAWLRNQGFDRAQSVAGGIHLWATSLDPAIPTY